MQNKKIKPDYNFWIKNSHWNIREAAWLLLDIEPRIAEDDYRERHNIPDEAPPDIKYKVKEVGQLLKRGPFILYETVAPVEILEWCLEMKIQIPKGLSQAANEINLFENEKKKEKEFLNSLNNKNKPKWDKWLLLDEWELTKAIALSCGLDPNVEQELLTKNNPTLLEKVKERTEIVDTGVRAKKLKVKIGVDYFEDYPDQPIERVTIDPKEFIKWLKSKNLEIPQELENWHTQNQEEKTTSQPSSDETQRLNLQKNNKTKGYKLRHQKKRDTVLGAAVCAMANFSDLCKVNGRYSGNKIVDIIEREDELRTFVEDSKGEMIMGRNGMVDLINSCLKLDSLSKNKMEEIYKKMK